MGRAMPLFDSRTFRILATIAAFFLCAAFIYAGRHTLLAFLFALLFAYVLEPPVERIRPFVGGSRLRAIGVVYLVLVLAAAGAITLAAPRVFGEGRRLVGAFPGLLDQV